MRPSILALTSLSLVAIAGAAVAGSAVAEEMPSAYQTAATAPIIERTVIIVQPGDTVYGLGRRYGVKPAELISVNEIAPPYMLAVGEELILPEASPAAVARRIAMGPIEGEAAPQAAIKPLNEGVQMVRASATTSAPTQLQYSEPMAIQPEPVVAIERLDALYTVRPGDTMYSLSRRFEIGLEELAAANNMAAPYRLSVSQRLVIPGAMEAPASIEVAPAAPAMTAKVTPSPDARAAARELGMNAVATSPASDDDAILISKTGDSRFSWPIRGAIVEGYGTTKDGLRNDGINIAAPIGAPIRSAADGEVIYTGAELDGYGNLLLVRHNDGWVSAYAHTDSIVVKKGDTVRQGQVVAKVGRTGAVEAPQLHFELRHELQPRDPLAALEGRDIKAVSLNR